MWFYVTNLMVFQCWYKSSISNIELWTKNKEMLCKNVAIATLSCWSPVVTTKHRRLLTFGLINYIIVELIKNAKMYFFIKLQFVCFLTLLLLIAELVLDHFTHSLTLLVVAWQTLYNFISLFISSVSLALSHNNSKELELKVSFRRSWCQ